MTTWIVLAKSRARAEELTKSLSESEASLAPEVYDGPPAPNNARKSIISLHFPAFDLQAAGRAFETEQHASVALMTISEAIAAGSNVAVLADDVILSRMNALRDSGWNAFLARLILSFPEVQWRLFLSTQPSDFSNFHGSDDEKQGLQRDATELATRTYPPDAPIWDRTDIFDYLGLRDWVHRVMRLDNDTREDASHLPTRKRVCVAVDDESPYANLHAYAAYRMHFRARAASTLEEADKCLADEATEQPYLVFDDISLGFRAEGDDLKDLMARDARWPRIADASMRIFVTAARGIVDRKPWIGSPKSDVAATCQYIWERIAEGNQNILVRHKPISVIALLATDPTLAESIETPQPRIRSKQPVNPLDHSRPINLLRIAEFLIERSSKYLADAHTVEGATTAAVLALDAHELLGNGSPTQNIEALRLCHRFEIIAECLFSGVNLHDAAEYHIDQVRKVVPSIVGIFGNRRVVADMQVSILVDMMRTYRDFAQWDEEQLCLQHIRWLKAWTSPSSNPLGFLISLPRLYVTWLVNSAISFGVMILAILTTLTSAYLAVLGDLNRAIQASMTAFFSLGSPFLSETCPNLPDKPASDADAEALQLHIVALREALWCEQATRSDTFVVISIVAILLGVLHLGVGAAHVYAAISRR